MSYKTVFYCPDKHIQYNLTTLDSVGVGGGVTARVRAAHALARRGHQVQLFVNCPEEGYLSGVEYLHFSSVKTIRPDIFIATTSGDGLDLSAISAKNISASLKILFIHGDPMPKGFDDRFFDFIYAPSNFIGQRVVSNWGIRSQKIFVTHHGVEESLYAQGSKLNPGRDNYRMVYAGHPSKGLDSAVNILQILRSHDPRYSLHVFGGYQLWGQSKPLKIDEPGVTFHGLVGQQDLAIQMQKSGFCINLQSREEPFGMVVTEAMRAGCIVLASPVGAYPELVQNGSSGFLVSGDHTQMATCQAAAQVILETMQDASRMTRMRGKAVSTPITWDTVAQAWESHWDFHLNGIQGNTSAQMWQYAHCSLCHGRMLLLADGLHCLECGNFQNDIS
jgi:glycosyltransferase involved in cell wall biosynthesis